MKMLIIFWRTIRDRKISFLVYLLAAVMFLWMFVALYPSIYDQVDEFNQLIQAYPESLMKTFGIENVNFDTFEKFLAIEHVSIVWPLLIIFLAISMAGADLARDIEQGTMEMTLARPVSRSRIYIARYLAGVIMITVFTLVSFYVVVPLAKLSDVQYHLASYWYISVAGLLFGLAIFSFSFMLSAMFSERSRVYLISGGMLLVMYVFKIITSFKENYADLNYLSFFYYFDPEKALIQNEIELTSGLVFVGVIMVAAVIGAIWFEKRDIAV